MDPGWGVLLLALAIVAGAVAALVAVARAATAGKPVLTDEKGRGGAMLGAAMLGTHKVLEPSAEHLEELQREWPSDDEDGEDPPPPPGGPPLR